MSREQEIKNLIAEHWHHLNILKQQAAEFGHLHVPTHILIQIEKREAEIEKLTEELEEIVEAYHSAPLMPPPVSASSNTIVSPTHPPVTTGSTLISPNTKKGSNSFVTWVFVGVGIFILALLGGLLVKTIFVDPPTPTLSAESDIKLTTLPTNPPPPSPTLTATQSTALPEPWFGEIIFTDCLDGFTPCNGPVSLFPKGITEIYAIFEFRDMLRNDTWERIWYRNNQKILQSSKETWNNQADGINIQPFNINESEPIPPGNWRLELYLNDKLIQSASFTIEDE